MSIIAEHKDLRILKSGIILILAFVCLISTIQAQELVTNSTSMGTQADGDWKALNAAVGYFGSTEEQEEARKAGHLHLHYDKYIRKSSQLAKAFWANYPEDKRRDGAFRLFFNAYTEPFFLLEVPDSVAQLLTKIPRHDRRHSRLKPIDDFAWKQWRQTGDAMVANVVNSNESLQCKEVAAFQLISRELRQAIKLNNGLTKDKSSETNYWNRFEIQYWQHVRLLLEIHINKYAALEVVDARVQNILRLIKIYSTAASDAYWNYFFEITGVNNPLSDQPGIRALHELAEDNVEAIEVLKAVDYTKPLDMSFLDMDGDKVDLSKMRGKVVLIDFWATYCGPCIKEMPHVRSLYDKYRGHGFEVVGIAADGDGKKERIEAILEKTRANWSQCLDKGLDTSISFHDLYKIKVLPTVWLLNKEGVIVDRNARGERLEPLIRKYLGLE